MVVKCPRCGGSRITRLDDKWKCEDCGYLLGGDSFKEHERSSKDAREIGSEKSFHFKIEKDFRTQELLRAIRDNKLRDYRPVVDFEHGVRYPEAERVVKAADATLETSLEALEEDGILISEIWDNLVVCPNCGSHKLFIQLRCPSCGSGKLVRKSTIQHLSCGHYDLEEEFVRGDRLVCPKCHKSLKAIGVDYRRPGLTYKCLNCGSLTPVPRVKYVCANGHEFYDDEFALKELKLYKLNPAKKSEIEKLLFNVKPVSDLLTKYGFYVEAPVTLRGESGVELDFSFAAWLNEAEKKDGEPPFLVGEVIVSNRPVDVGPIFALKAESVDMRFKVAVILAVPGLDETARSLAKSYGIHVLEADSLSELNEKVEEFIGSLVRSIRGSKGA